MSFHESARFPEDISYGSRGGPGFFTNIIQSEGGSEQRIARWSQARRTYDVKYGIKSIDSLRAVQRFYLCRYGPAYGFRYKDWVDFSTNANDHGAPAALDTLLGTGNGSNALFQLRKLYTDSGFSIVRVLTKPLVGSVRVAVNNVEVFTGWTVDTTTGVVSFVTPPPISHTVKAGCYFDVPVRFADETDQALFMSYDDFNQGSSQIPLIELMDPTPVPRTTTEPGGSKEICPLAPPTLDMSARVWIIQTLFTGECYLPDLALVPTGGPIFYIVNLGPDDLVVKVGAGGSTIITIGVGEGAEFVVSVSFDGIKNWIAF